jgi:hypothetical protein
MTKKAVWAFGALSVAFGLSVLLSRLVFGTEWPGIVLTLVFWSAFFVYASRQMDAINKEAARKRFGLNK